MKSYHVDIQYVPESVTLLNMVARPAPYITNYMNYLASRYGVVPDERAGRVVDLLQEIEDAARAEFSGDMETVKFYCDAENDFSKPDSFANILVLVGSVCDRVRTVQEQAEYLKNLPEQEYLTEFYEILKSYGASTAEAASNGKETVTDILDAIVQMNEPDARKLHLQQLFMHHKEHQEVLLGLMLRAQKILKKYEKKLKAFGEEAIAYLKEELQEQSLADYFIHEFYNETHLSTENKESDTYVSYLKAATLGFYFKGRDVDSAEGIVCFLGVIFSKNLNIRTLMKQRNTLSEEKVIAMLKLLADKSKFQILSATVDKSAYGAELANMLGLTTATISHHTTALLDQNLLSLDKVDTKIYYRTNPEMIRALIQYLQDKLLQE